MTDRHPTGNGPGARRFRRTTGTTGWRDDSSMVGPGGPAWMRNPGPADLPRVSVVIPVLNESVNLRWVLPRIPPGVHEVVLVDGRSIDDTVNVAVSLRPDIVVVTEARHGKGRALRAGFAAATGDLIIMLDGDGSMDPAEVPRFVERLRDVDFVKGSRCLAGGDSDDFTWLRRAGNHALLGIVNQFFGQGFTDLCYGYCGFRRSALEVLNLTADGFEIETQLVVRAIKAGLRIAEVPSVEFVRMGGHSNLRVLYDGPRVLRTILQERFGLARARTPLEVAPSRRRTLSPDWGPPPEPALRVAAQVQVVGASLENEAAAACLPVGDRTLSVSR